MKHCYNEEAPKEQRPGNLSATPAVPTKQMTEEERRKSLEEVERQQQEFGIQ